MHKTFLLLVCLGHTLLGKRLQATEESKRSLETWTSASEDANTQSFVELYRTKSGKRAAGANPLRTLVKRLLVPRQAPTFASALHGTRTLVKRLLVPRQASTFSAAPHGTRALSAGPSVGPGLAAPLIVPSSAFASELAYRTVSASAYAGSPLALLDYVTRAKVLTGFARRWDADEHPGAVMEDAVPGEQVNGAKRAQHNAAYDWQRDGQRVACKSGQLTWYKGRARWALQFNNIKLDATDELLLALYAPEEVHLFRYNLTVGLSSAGKRTPVQGQRVTYYGPANEPDLHVALREILVKLNTGATPLASAGFDDPRLASAIKSTPLPFTASAYGGVPLADCSGVARAIPLTSMVRRLDEAWLHPGAVITDALREEVTGNWPGYDWQRDGKRVVCKTAQLGWDAGGVLWKVRFSEITTTTYDELLLAVYTPEGVHLFRHDGNSGLSTTSKSTAISGKKMEYFGSRNERNWSVALGKILGKMEAKGCTRLVFVPWGV